MRSFFSLLFATPLCLSGQALVPSVITALSTTLNETSGLVVLNGEVWTQLDSGNPNALYRIDPSNGQVLRTVTVGNASNVDWEEITTDGQWLYIGDFGNNLGSRTDLRIYRVSLAELLDLATTELLADTIRFTYPLQTDFTPADRANDWDMEAMVAVGDSLFLFSKNWLSGTSYLYALAAEPGDHFASRRDTLDAQGLITGAAYDADNASIVLVGYTNGTYRPFVWGLDAFAGTNFFSGRKERRMLDAGLVQMEAIAVAGSGIVYLTNEWSLFGSARLWQLPVEVGAGPKLEQRSSVALWPSPNDGRFVIEVDRRCLLELFDMEGRRVRDQVLRPGTNHVDFGDLPNGIYVVRTGSGNHVLRMSVVR